MFEIIRPNHIDIETPWRKFKKEYAEFESNWYLTQDLTPNLIGEAAKIWKGMGDKLNSNYGYQITRDNQLSKVINILSEHKNTRRAIITIYDGKECDLYEDDTPCCLNLGFEIIDDMLNMTIHFRSQDLIFGFCNDQYTLFKYHKLVLDMLSYKRYPNLKLGTSTWMINNLHIYDQHINKKENYFNK